MGKYKKDYVKSEIGMAFGKLGGQATAKKYGKEYFKKLSDKSHEKRRQNILDQKTAPEFKLSDDTATQQPTLKQEEDTTGEMIILE